MLTKFPTAQQSVVANFIADLALLPVTTLL